MKTLSLLLGSCIVATCLGCEIGPRSGRGLRLPDGDIERGQVAFRDLGCIACHGLADDPSASGRSESETKVILGGEVSHIETHGELVTSIINPSHEISRRYPRDQVADGDVSKMKAINERMTVAQLIDLTAFLQSKYKLRDESLYLP